ncbi:dTDP-4-dehydrorhamnose 3,5-epimerase, partial [Hyphomicrobiales bacterium]|nr:dTDP-4-dehydrorhamnose 3,5-epimerase [Hyphomicrobiales bacterium]
IRIKSKTYGQFSTFKLSEENGFLIIPRGFAHGFCTLTDNTKVLYKVDNHYNKEFESGIIWNDIDLNINWPLDEGPSYISDKDKNLKPFDV